jgi:hypothetical protein
MKSTIAREGRDVATSAQRGRWAGKAGAKAAAWRLLFGPDAFSYLRWRFLTARGAGGASRLVGVVTGVVDRSTLRGAAPALV